MTTKQEIESRIRIASAFKRHTFGTGEIEPYVLGDVDTRNPARPDNRGKHARTPELNLKTRAGRARGEKARKGGITGVGPAGNYRPMRFRGLMPDLSEPIFLCAVEAAEAHNTAFLAAHPAYPEFQCDIEAVWRKYGCSCGKHRRPSK